MKGNFLWHSCDSNKQIKKVIRKSLENALFFYKQFLREKMGNFSVQTLVQDFSRNLLQPLIMFPRLTSPRIYVPASALEKKILRRLEIFFKAFGSLKANFSVAPMYRVAIN